MFLALLLLPAAANAAPVTWVFEGDIYDVSDYGKCPTTAGLGDRITFAAERIIDGIFDQDTQTDLGARISGLFGTCELSAGALPLFGMACGSLAAWMQSTRTGEVNDQALELQELC